MKGRALLPIAGIHEILNSELVETFVVTKKPYDVPRKTINVDPPDHAPVVHWLVQEFLEIAIVQLIHAHIVWAVVDHGNLGVLAGPIRMGGVAAHAIAYSEAQVQNGSPRKRSGDQRPEKGANPGQYTWVWSEEAQRGAGRASFYTSLKHRLRERVKALDFPHTMTVGRQGIRGVNTRFLPRRPPTRASYIF